MTSSGSPLVQAQRGPPRRTSRLLTHWLLFFSLGLAIAGLDLWTKHEIFKLLQVRITKARMADGVERMAVEDHQHFVIIPNWFELEANINYGAFSGWFHNRTGLLTALSFLALLVVPGFLLSSLRGPAPQRLWFTAALGLLWGGTMGNLYDRASLGYVRDFIKWFYVDAQGRSHVWPNFNIADSAICVGVGIIVVLMLIESRSRKKEPAAGSTAP